MPGTSWFWAIFCFGWTAVVQERRLTQTQAAECWASGFVRSCVCGLAQAREQRADSAQPAALWWGSRQRDSMELTACNHHYCSVVLVETRTSTD